ncbi:unnamed protein product [Nesidiocoris tenuis]|uniref:Uncharacterized protein n=1 Tax=Nesidiocoris tenuis TaxID=355587 RepID=A0A6H5HKU4_9HEMI|nr:unnamed protein product [Nesidiocoris tenuis]
MKQAAPPVKPLNHCPGCLVVELLYQLPSVPPRHRAEASHPDEVSSSEHCAAFLRRHEAGPKPLPSELLQDGARPQEVEYVLLLACVAHCTPLRRFTSPGDVVEVHCATSGLKHPSRATQARGSIIRWWSQGVQSLIALVVARGRCSPQKILPLSIPQHHQNSLPGPRQGACVHRKIQLHLATSRHLHPLGRPWESQANPLSEQNVWQSFPRHLHHLQQVFDVERQGLEIKRGSACLEHHNVARPQNTISYEIIIGKAVKNRLRSEAMKKTTNKKRVKQPVCGGEYKLNHKDREKLKTKNSYSTVTVKEEDMVVDMEESDLIRFCSTRPLGVNNTVRVHEKDQSHHHLHQFAGRYFHLQPNLCTCEATSSETVNDAK